LSRQDANGHAAFFAEILFWLCFECFGLLLRCVLTERRWSLVLRDVERCDYFMLSFRCDGEFFLVLERLLELIR